MRVTAAMETTMSCQKQIQKDSKVHRRHSIAGKSDSAKGSKSKSLNRRSLTQQLLARFQTKYVSLLAFWIRPPSRQSVVCATHMPLICHSSEWHMCGTWVAHTTLCLQGGGGVYNYPCCACITTRPAVHACVLSSIYLNLSLQKKSDVPYYEQHFCLSANYINAALQNAL